MLSVGMSSGILVSPMRGRLLGIYGAPQHCCLKRSAPFLDSNPARFESLTRWTKKAEWSKEKKGQPGRMEMTKQETTE